MRNIFILVLFLIGSSSVFADNKPVHCRAKRAETKVANFGKTYMPFATLGVALYKRDWIGAGFSQVLIHGMYPLNRKLDKKFNVTRPCGCKGSFPSGHMIVYATSSSFLHYRYGWEYGVPAYVATVIFAADRVNNKAHRWRDMIGTFAVVNLFTYLITPKFESEAKVSETHKDLPVDFKYLEYVENKKTKMIPEIQAYGKQVTAGLTFKF
ncbi:MAG: hypothetical protein KBB83_05905 [Alphaproteobacteria bacterium]|nr:hypothetical protein [Alphaproteobacteria bacterium]